MSGMLSLGTRQLAMALLAAFNWPLTGAKALFARQTARSATKMPPKPHDAQWIKLAMASFEAQDRLARPRAQLSKAGG